ncbi:hypothetical protein AKJ09_01172 [Labilithrix luteola]|uniref:Uncharacterized protein n=1 Tax=Labilithrix luteola TaxID=1391654 RepID=A0A0K1PLU5_9BACT|nr:hypothetical protein AKJ09_01172 [Labilithrix luteola]
MSQNRGGEATDKRVSGVCVRGGGALRRATDLFIFQPARASSRVRPRSWSRVSAP